MQNENQDSLLRRAVVLYENWAEGKVGSTSANDMAYDLYSFIKQAIEAGNRAKHE